MQIQGDADERDYYEDRIPCPASSFIFADRATAVVFMTTASISVIATYVTMRECMADYRTRRRNIQDRAIPTMVFSVNAGYFLYFFPKCFGPIPAPSELSRCAWGTMGTIQTCTAQAFFIQLGVWAFAFQLVALVWFYTAIVKYSWRERQLAKHVKWAVGSIWTMSFMMAVVGLWLKVYNFKDQNCYVSPYPPMCSNNGVCLRGGRAASIFNLAVKIPYIFLASMMSVFFFTVFSEVRKIEEQVSRYNSETFGRIGFPVRQIPSASGLSSTTTSRENMSSPISVDVYMQSGATSYRARVNRAKSQAVAIQAFLLAGWTNIAVFLVIFEMFAPKFVGYKNYHLHMFKIFVDNLQGLVFFIIFARPRVNNMRTPEGKFLRKLLFCSGIWNVMTMSRSPRISSISTGGNGNQTSAHGTHRAEHADSVNYDLTSVHEDDHEQIENRGDDHNHEGGNKHNYEAGCSHDYANGGSHDHDKPDCQSQDISTEACTHYDLTTIHEYIHDGSESRGDECDHKTGISPGHGAVGSHDYDTGGNQEHDAPTEACTRNEGPER